MRAIGSDVAILAYKVREKLTVDGERARRVVNVDRHPFPILWSIIGAAVFVALAHLISRGPTHQWRHD